MVHLMVDSLVVDMSRVSVDLLLALGIVIIAAAAGVLPAVSCANDPPSSDNHTTPGYGTGGRQDWAHVQVRQGAHLFWWLHYATDTNDVQPALPHHESNNPAGVERPLVIWLQGGPGASATGYGNFAEIGPLDVQGRPRPHAWTNSMHVLFIDAPVGAGFSWAESAAAFSRSDLACAIDLIELMSAFYARRADMRSLPVHIFAESYGAKLAVEMARLWAMDSAVAAEQRRLPPTLMSVSSVDGWIGPVSSMLSWAPFLLHTGNVAHSSHWRIAASAQTAERLVAAGRWSEATMQWGRTEQLVAVETGGIDWYNVQTELFDRRRSTGLGAVDEEEEKADEEESEASGAGSDQSSVDGGVTVIMGDGHDDDEQRSVELSEQQLRAEMYALLVHKRSASTARPRDASERSATFRGRNDGGGDPPVDEDALLDRLMNGPVRKALNISERIVWDGQSSATFAYMNDAFMRPAIETVEWLLTNSTVAVNILSGQLDLIVATSGTVEWTRQLRWPGAMAFRDGVMQRLVGSDGRVEGYVKSVGRLTYYAVKWAGHMVPRDNPRGMDEILRRVTRYDGRK